MGILNKLTSAVSDDSSETRSTVSRLMPMMAACMVLLSALSGAALAADNGAVSVVSSGYDSDAGVQSSTIEISGQNITAGDQVTVTYTAPSEDVNFSEAQPEFLNTSSGTSISLVSLNQSSDSVEITYEYASNASSETVPITLSGYTVTNDSTIDFEATGALSANTSYSVSEPVGTLEIQSVTEADTGNETENFNYEIVNSDGTVVASGTDASAPLNKSDLPTGTYDVTISGVDDYNNLTNSVEVTQDGSSPTQFTLARTQLTSEVTVEQNGTALESFDIAVYEGDSIGDNESALESVSVNDSQSNTVQFAGLDSGADYTYEVTYTDEDGNETTYTETVTVDDADATNGTVTQTIDVDSSEDIGVVGGVAGVGMTILGLFLGAIVLLGILIGPFAVLYILGSGIRNQF